MGASFHWMDRDRLLTVLDKLILAEGGVALVNNGGISVWSGSDSGWIGVTKEVVTEFLGFKRRAGSATYQHPTDPHELVLARSSFSHVEKIKFTKSEEKTIVDIVGLQLSTSYASPVQLGDRIDEFCEVLTERLLKLEPSGVFRGETITEVLIATRY